MKMPHWQKRIHSHRHCAEGFTHLDPCTGCHRASRMLQGRCSPATQFPSLPGPGHRNGGQDARAICYQDPLGPRELEGPGGVLPSLGDPGSGSSAGALPRGPLARGGGFWVARGQSPERPCPGGVGGGLSAAV